MRIIHTDQVRDLVEALFRRAATELPADVVSALEEGRRLEKGEMGRAILGELLENERIARNEGIPVCQDCGLAVLFMEIGQEACFEGRADVRDRRRGPAGLPGRFPAKSSVTDPLYDRKTPVTTRRPSSMRPTFRGKGSGCCRPQGHGSENASTITMLSPPTGGGGCPGRSANRGPLGANACPPLVVGVGIGGNFERRRFWPSGRCFDRWAPGIPTPVTRPSRSALLGQVNALGIGPRLRGTVTALDVHVEFALPISPGCPLR